MANVHHTNKKTGIPYITRFLQKWPTPKASKALLKMGLLLKLSQKSVQIDMEVLKLVTII